MRLKATEGCRGRPGSGAGEPGRRAEEGAAGTGLLHVPAGRSWSGRSHRRTVGRALVAHARAESSAARSPACTCLRGGCSVPQLHLESSSPSPVDRGHSLSISWPQHWVGQLPISSHPAAHMAPRCESKQVTGLVSFPEALRSAATSQGSGSCHCPALVGAIPTTAVGVPVCSGHCHVSALLWALGQERNKVVNRERVTLL